MRTEVEDASGVRGEVTGISRDERELLVTLHSNERIRIPLNRLTMTNPQLFYYDSNFGELTSSGTSNVVGRERTVVIPVTDEVPVIKKSFVETAKVKFKKSVTSRIETIEENLRQERVDVARIKVDKILDKPAEVRTEGDTTIIPVQEEVLVVAKRVHLKEEIHVKRWADHKTQTYQVELRKEEITVERSELTRDTKEKKS